MKYVNPFLFPFSFPNPNDSRCAQPNVPRDIAAGIFKSFEKRTSLISVAAEYRPVLNPYI